MEMSFVYAIGGYFAVFTVMRLFGLGVWVGGFGLWIYGCGRP